MFRLIAALLIPYVVAAINGLATQTTVKTWYPALQLPPFRPPNWLFAPAWTVFYTLMGIASYFIYKSGADGTNTALAVYAIQLGLNACWSPLFFWQKSILGGLVVLTALFVAAIATCWLFFGVSELAGWIFLPYIGWLGYAWSLNAYIWYYN